MRNILKLSAVTLFLAAAAFGQASAINGEITGTVTDPSGAAIAGAGVQATNTTTGLKQSAKTNESGLYRIPLLPLGAYELEVQSQGFGAKKVTGIVLSAGLVASVDVGLAVSSTVTTVEVSASGLITEPSRIDLGSTLSENMTRNMPLVSRNPNNFILFQPN